MIETCYFKNKKKEIFTNNFQEAFTFFMICYFKLKNGIEKEGDK